MENSKKTVKGQDGSAKTELSFLFLMFMLLAIGFAFALTNTQYSVMMASLIVVGGHRVAVPQTTGAKSLGWGTHRSHQQGVMPCGSHIASGEEASLLPPFYLHWSRLG